MDLLLRFRFTFWRQCQGRLSQKSIHRIPIESGSREQHGIDRDIDKLDSRAVPLLRQRTAERELAKQESPNHQRWAQEESQYEQGSHYEFDRRNRISRHRN